MWALRFLNGPLAGEIMPLKLGGATLGRSADANIVVNDKGISKIHAEFIVSKNNLRVIDKGSRNGTFVNGIKIQTENLKVGDKISFHQVVAEIVPENFKLRPRLSVAQIQSGPSGNALQLKSNHSSAVPVAIGGGQNALMAASMPSDGANALAPYATSGANPWGHPQGSTNLMQDNLANSPADGTERIGEPKGLIEKLSRYIDDVAMPGIYKLTELIEFNIVILFFWLGYAVALSFLAIIPMIAITTESIQVESQRRALSIARNLASINTDPLLKDDLGSLSVAPAEMEDGVDEAYIIRVSDGTVMAPASRAGAVLDIEKIETSRSAKSEIVSQLNSSHIYASVPMMVYSTETGETSIKAVAVVMYNMGSLAIDEGRTFSLFIQVMFIALLVGGFLYFIFIKLVHYPIRFIYKGLSQSQMDVPLELEIKLPLFHDLLAQLNSLREKASRVKDDSQNIKVSKDVEAANMVELIGYPAISLNSELMITAINSSFISLMGGNIKLNNQPIAVIPDQALQKNIIDLIERSTQNPSIIVSNELEFSGEKNQINATAILGESQIEYFIISIVPLGGGT